METNVIISMSQIANITKLDRALKVMIASTIILARPLLPSQKMAGPLNRNQRAKRKIGQLLPRLKAKRWHT